jgi:hypothetical protein
MEKVKHTPTNKDKAVPMEKPRKANHSEKIKSQVLAAIGRPPRLDRVEVSPHHGSKYRVNIWQQPEPDRHLAVTIAPRIGLSYYVTVSDAGEIIDSSPPLARLCSSA